MGMQGFFLSIGDMFITGSVNTFGTNVVAAFATGMRVQQFAMLMHFTITEAFAVFAGQNLGARKFDRIREGFRKLAAVLLALALASAVVIFIFGGAFVRLFISASDPNLDAIVSIAAGYLRISSCFYVFLTMILLFNNALRGMGEALMPLLSGIMEVVAKIGLSIVLGRLYGYVGVWFAGPVGWALGIIPTAICCYRGRWEKLADRVVDSESVRIKAESVRFY